MMKIIEYFLHNKRLNYVLLFFLLFLGMHAYQSIPKELFPEIALDKISISGAYSGASAENLDKMAVRDIEDELGNINGVESIETVIHPGSFSIIINLENGADKGDALDKAKDAIARSRQYLPSDMVEPVAQIINRNRPLISLSLSSDTLSKGELIERAKEIKSKIARLQYISEVSIYGDADQEVSIRLRKDQISGYGLDPTAVITAVSNLSYIYPIGDIKESGNYIFLSTVHGKEGEDAWESTLIKVGEHQVRLGDIAHIEITYPQDKTLSTFNGRSNMTLVISKGPEGNAIELSKTLRAFAGEKLSVEYPEIYFDFYQDTSKPVKDRLNVVIS
ncbi:MAG: efflux RND transporter permease subunit, partial [Campylobacterales bacterium]|nr:efflux RND transporter permease subunit [Campylobacterales bacterium]